MYHSARHKNFTGKYYHVSLYIIGIFHMIIYPYMRWNIERPDDRHLQLLSIHLIRVSRYVYIYICMRRDRDQIAENTHMIEQWRNIKYWNEQLKRGRLSCKRPAPRYSRFSRNRGCSTDRDDRMSGRSRRHKSCGTVAGRKLFQATHYTLYARVQELRNATVRSISSYPLPISLGFHAIVFKSNFMDKTAW